MGNGWGCAPAFCKKSTTCSYGMAWGTLGGGAAPDLTLNLHDCHSTTSANGVTSDGATQDAFRRRRSKRQNDKSTAGCLCGDARRAPFKRGGCLRGGVGVGSSPPPPPV